jgi:hypothetical protein
MLYLVAFITYHLADHVNQFAAVASCIYLLRYPKFRLRAIIEHARSMHAEHCINRWKYFAFVC